MVSSYVFPYPPPPTIHHPDSTTRALLFRTDKSVLPTELRWMIYDLVFDFASRKIVFRSWMLDGKHCIQAFRSKNGISERKNLLKNNTLLATKEIRADVLEWLYAEHQFQADETCAHHLIRVMQRLGGSGVRTLEIDGVTWRGVQRRKTKDEELCQQPLWLPRLRRCYTLERLTIRSDMAYWNRLRQPSSGSIIGAEDIHSCLLMVCNNFEDINTKQLQLLVKDGKTRSTSHILVYKQQRVGVKNLLKLVHSVYDLKECPQWTQDGGDWLQELERVSP